MLSFLVLFLVLFCCCCCLFVCLFVFALFFVKYLVCANKLTCLGVSQDYLGAGEKNRWLAQAALPPKLQVKYNKPVYLKQ